MFLLSENEYNKIIDVISSICCECSSAYCSESDCDIHKISEILNRHLVYDCTEQTDDNLPI